MKHTPEEINCWTQPPPLGSKVIVDDSQGYSAVEDGSLVCSDHLMINFKAKFLVNYEW